MYAVEDETFTRARSIVTALATELAAQEDSASTGLMDVHELVRRSADVDVPAGGEAAYLSALADSLARLFSVEEMFPRKRRARHS